MQGSCLDEEKLFPEIVLARYYNTRMRRNSEKTPSWISEHYEVSIYLDGNGQLFADNQEYPLARGCVRLNHPGTKLCSLPDYSCYSFSFRLPYCQHTSEILRHIFPFFFGWEEAIVQGKQIVELFASEQMGSKVQMNALILKLLYDFYQRSQTNAIAQPIFKCCQHMQTHYGEDITLEDLGQLTGYSPLHMMRIFKNSLGITPHEYLNRLRIAHAKWLLISTDQGLSEISEACGLSSLSNFQVFFKKNTGMNPGKYRRNSDMID